MDGFIRHLDKGRARICIRINGNGGNAHALGRADDAAGNFAPVCNEDFLKHRGVPYAIFRQFYLNVRPDQASSAGGML